MTWSAASFPVRIEIGNPEGLNVHWPAWLTLGIGVSTDLAILAMLWTAGMKLLVKDQPVMPPSELPVSFSRVSGVEMK